MDTIPLNFRHIEYVIAAGELGGAAAAARTLNVSQPSVSAAIAKVEAALGRRLFIRAKGVGLEPTRFGRRALADLRRLRAQARATFRTAEADAAPAEVDIGVLSTLGPSCAPALIRRFKETAPEARVRLHEADLATLSAWLEAERLDCALLYDVGLPQEAPLVPLKDVRPYALVAEDHRLASRGSVALAELLEDPLILMSLPYSRDYFMSLIRLQGCTARIAYETGSLEMLRSMVANGLGVGILATELPYRTTYDGRAAQTLAIEGAAPPHRIALALAPSMQESWLSTTLVALAREVVGESVSA